MLKSLLVATIALAFTSSSALAAVRVEEDSSPLTAGNARELVSKTEPPADISGLHDPDLVLHLRIRTDKFVWIARDSSLKRIQVDFETSGPKNPDRFENITLLFSNIKCYNQEFSASADGGYPPCVQINFVRPSPDQYERLSYLVNSRIEARQLSSNGSLFSAVFRNVVFEQSVVDIHGIEPVVTRYDDFKAAPVNFKFIGVNNMFLGLGSVFTIRDMAGKLLSADQPGQMVRFESEGPLDNLRLNIYNMFNVDPKSSSRAEGNSALSVEVIVPAAKQAAMSFSFFSDVFLYIVGTDIRARDSSSVAAANFSRNSYLLITNFKTVFPFPHLPARYSESNIFVNANFDASTLYIDKCDFKRGGGGIIVGHGKEGTSPTHLMKNKNAAFANGAFLNVTEVESSYAATTGGTMMNFFVNFENGSHGLVRKCPNATVVRFHNSDLLRRSSLTVQDSGMITLDFTSLSFGQSSLSQASLVYIVDNAIASAFIRNVNTTGGHLQLRRNIRSSYTHHMFDAELHLTNITGTGVISDIEGELHPIVNFFDFAGVFELWSNTFFHSQIDPIKITFEFSDNSRYIAPKKLIFSWDDAVIHLVDDFSGNPRRRDALLKSVSFGCASVSTFDTVTQSATIISPNPTPCGKLDTMERCSEGGFWFYKSVARKEYVMIEDPETCFELQTDIPTF